jgi:hypothetical protein
LSQRLALALLLCLLAACSKRELRGQWTRSGDGKTYLVVAESPGCSGIRVDGKRWPYPLGARGVVGAGTRRISCSDGSNEVEIEVKAGTVFKFDYWGP